MNGRGEVEQAVSQATMRAATRAVVGQLLKHSDNDTAEVPWKGEPPPTIAVLAKGAKLAERTVRRELAEAGLHHWLVRYPSERGTVAGQLQPGEDCHCRDRAERPAAVCQWKGCRRSLAHKRADAEYCNDRHRMAAKRELDRIHSNAKAVQSRNSVRPSSPNKTAQSPNTSQVRDVEGPPALERGSDTSHGATEVAAAAWSQGEPSQPVKPRSGVSSSGPDIVSPASHGVKGETALDPEPARQLPGTYEKDGGRDEPMIADRELTTRRQTTVHAGSEAEVVEGGRLRPDLDRAAQVSEHTPPAMIAVPFEEWI
jgi:hypothetical protein